MIASKWFDPVLGLDIHIVMMPTPAGPVPTPLPMPFVGLVFDPAGMAFALAFSMVTGGGPSITLVNGLPATNTGTAATNKLTLPHLPVPGIAFQKGMPSNDADLMFGGLKVTFGGSHIVRLGDIALSCSDPMRLPTSVVLAIPLGSLVIVPRPPSPDLMGLVFAAGGKLVAKLVSKAAKLGKALFKKLRAAQKASGALARLSARLMARQGGKLGRLRSAWNRAVCFLTGHPVDVATGRVLTDHVDFELPGALPLRFARCYDSSLSWRDGPLGHGWSHSLDQAVWPERGRVVYRAEDGRDVEFITLDLPDRVLRAGESLYHPLERLTLRCHKARHYEVEDAAGVVREFAAAEGELTSRIVRKRARAGGAIDYHYEHGRLAEVTDGSGRKVLLTHDTHGRLVRVDVLGTGGEHSTQAQLTYDGAGDLVEVKDALEHAFRHEYVGHLLVKETNRNGLSFYFQYDGLGAAARCVRTWGDDGIYDHAITYDTVNRRTLVENSLGQITLYQMDDASQVVAITDALGQTTKYTYDERSGQKASETDPLGATTTWRYDDHGNCLETVHPDGAKVAVDYDHHLPARAVDAVGGEWRWGYDSKGRLIGRVDPLGHKTQYHWEDGRLTGLTDPAGQLTSLGYDAAGNLTSVKAPDGGESRWEYDGFGRCRTAIDVKGNEQRRERDALGRVVHVVEPDGNLRDISYDAEGNVVRALDKHHDVRFVYRGMGRIASRSEAGTTVAFEYDSEEQLVEIRNEAGHKYSFEIGPTGQVAVEWDWSGRRRQYLRDGGGRVSRILRPGGLVSKYEHDVMGRVTAVEHPDSRETFEYRPDGSMVAASNGAAALRFDRDLRGRLLRERSNDDWVESDYNAIGLRVRLRSSKGLDQRIERNAMGDVVGLRGEVGGDGWEARLERDELGLELERTLPGGVAARWERDRLGRPLRQEILVAGVPATSREYRWAANDRLHMIEDTLKGPVRFSHDALGNLAAATHDDGRVELRMPDAVGNLFRTEDRGDRRYGPSGELLEARGPDGVTTYEYDPEGNLCKKTEPGGRVWTYQWNGAGMLAAVVRPDGERVTFGYDPFGRRLWKCFRGRTTRWIWDGNVPLHEWAAQDPAPAVAPATSPTTLDSAEKRRQALLVAQPAQGPPDPLAGTSQSPITWLFEPETFAPAAKLVGGERLSIVADHLGAPAAMYDPAGTLVWSADLDVYGAARVKAGSSEACPFRWPGQYEDVETGLHYNRYRYYDPSSGEFLASDPIGLRGGLNTFAYVDDPLVATDPLGLTPCITSDPRVAAAIASGRPIAIVGRRMARVNPVADELRRAGGNLKTYEPRNFRSTPGAISRADMEANREWLRYWAKEKKALIIDIGDDPKAPMDLSPFYELEKRSLYKNWAGDADVVQFDPGF